MCDKCKQKEDEYLVQKYRGQELISTQRLCEDCFQKEHTEES